VGIYGLMAYSVSRRQREFGIRIALGASRARILRLLYSGVFRLVFGGMALGVVLAWVARVWIASLLGEHANNTGAILLGGVLLSAVAAVAAIAPARRATRIHPVEALRSE